MEEWRPVPGHPLLEASSWGRVRSLPYDVPMPRGGFKVVAMAPCRGVPAASLKGSAHVRWQVTFRRRTYRVARLVCLAFHGLPPPGRGLVLHDDEDSANNSPGNLSWGTQKENMNAPGFIAYCRSRTGDKSPARIAAAKRSTHSI